uniref:Uncharacterized protein n=1 Tax=Rhizophora mucronata TaxID=61149 RepID=A0A2P2PKQ7_RHIMU
MQISRHKVLHCCVDIFNIFFMPDLGKCCRIFFCCWSCFVNLPYFTHDAPLINGG